MTMSLLPFGHDDIAKAIAGSIHGSPEHLINGKEAWTFYGREAEAVMNLLEGAAIPAPPSSPPSAAP